MTKQAWFCPSCQKHHAPHVDTCPAWDVSTVQPVYNPYRYVVPSTWTPLPGSAADVPQTPNTFTIKVSDGAWSNP